MKDIGMDKQQILYKNAKLTNLAHTLTMCNNKPVSQHNQLCENAVKDELAHSWRESPLPYQTTGWGACELSYSMET